MTAINLFESRAATLEAEEQFVIGSAIWKGVFNALLIEGGITSLMYLGWRLGMLAMQWAAS